MMELLQLMFYVAGLIASAIVVHEVIASARASVVMSCKIDHGHYRDSYFRCDCRCHRPGAREALEQAWQQEDGPRFRQHATPGAAA